MLTVSSLDLEKVQLILKLKHVVNDNELEAVPPVPIPSQPGKPRTKQIISPSASSIQQKLRPQVTVKFYHVKAKYLVPIPSSSSFLLAMSFYLVSLMLSSSSASRLRQHGDTAL